MKNNKERLIEAAADLFHCQGYMSTSVDDLLDATGVARSNFYYHFASKMELAVAVVRHWIDIYDRDLVSPALVAGSGSAAERLAALYARAADSQDPASGSTGCPLGRLSTDLAATEPAIRRLLDEYFSGVSERIRAMLAEDDRVRSGPASPEMVADLAVCVLEGSLLMSALRADPDEVRRAGTALVQLLELPEAA